MRPLVGIDLGTTHSAVATCDGDAVRVLGVPQLTARGEVSRRELLPSALYAPAEGEGLDDPFDIQRTGWVGGALAERRAAEVPSRGVLSAKSWLCHGRVDRTEAILPWGHDEPGLARISPVDAASHVLAHVRAAWELEHPGRSLAEADVVLTVPASFDEVARQLTLAAAEKAGLAVRLLEEPQAAFADFLHHQPSEALSRWVKHAGGELLALVVDVGGGTTDLSLLRLSVAASGDVVIERLAVGRHLLVGGDNMDLALAHHLEAHFAPKGERLPAGRFASLTLACRAAKETLFGPAAPESTTVTLLDKGARLVGGARSASLSRAEAERLVLEGFFPDPREPAPRTRSGLVAFGLPYEHDVAITRHVRAFLERQGRGRALVPRALLLNGGVFRSSALAARLKLSLDEWMAAEAQARGIDFHPLELLPCSSPDLAVARGAVAHGLALRGKGPRIGGGSARSFYVGVAGAHRSAADRLRKAVCLLPRGAKEGESHRADVAAFGLVVGRPVRIELLAADAPLGHAPGDLVELPHPELVALPAATVRFEAAEGARGRRRFAIAKDGELVRVAVEAELSPLGTVELSCVEEAPPHRRFGVSFELRGAGAPAPPAPVGAPSRVEAAISLVRAAFAEGAPARLAKDLVRELERGLGAERAEWPLPVLRAVADELLHDPRARRSSADHERVWWSLVGVCLRPGFGAPDDPRRLRRVAPLFAEGLAFEADIRCHQQLAIATRRFAAGLDERQQVALRDRVDPFVAPPEAKRKKPKGTRPQSEADLLDLAAWLERVPADRKAELGGWLLERTWTSRDPRLWAAIGRIGAREPAYASLHHVVPTAIAERWLSELLRERWDDLPTAPRAAASLARRTGDRGRDVRESLRAETLSRLMRGGAPERLVTWVRDGAEAGEAERAEAFGEALPVGLVWLAG